MVINLDYGKIVGDSFEYVKEGLAGKWMKWLLLLISTIIFPLIMGYMMRIYRGANPSPEPDDWVTMFIDGIKLFIVGIIYALPVIILEIAVIGSAGLALFAGTAHPSVNPSVNFGAFLGLLGAVIIGVIILLVVAFIIGLISTIANVRFARTGSFGEAFNFGAIIAHIGRIGWINYIISLVILIIIVGIVDVVCMVIPFIGFILFFLLLPAVIMFSARYITLVYDSAGMT
jgi:hypothetical protein